MAKAKSKPRPKPDAGPAAARPAPSVEPPTSPSAPQSRRTVIAPEVVAALAEVAARGVRGVRDLGGASGGGALGRVRTALPGAGDGGSSGVQVELGEVQAALDLSLVADYGVSVVQLAGDVRERVVRDVEELAGFEVTEVNIAVTDVRLDEEDG